MDYEILTFDEHAYLPKVIAHHLQKSITYPHKTVFSDGEIRISFDNPSLYTDKTAIIVQSLYAPIHERIIELLFLAHELKNASVRQVIAIIPYLAYSRQEKSDISGKSGQAEVIAYILQTSGIDVVITAELHTIEIMKFFSIPMLNVILDDLIAQNIKRELVSLEDVCLVAPDKGASNRVQAIAERLNDIGMIVFSKERFAADQTKVVGKTGECRGKIAIIIDDIIDTGGTALNVCKELHILGFSKIFGYFIHPVFSGDAILKIEQSPFTKIYVSNSIEAHNYIGTKITTFDISTEMVQALNLIS